MHVATFHTIPSLCSPLNTGPKVINIITALLAFIALPGSRCASCLRLAPDGLPCFSGVTHSLFLPAPIGWVQRPPPKWKQRQQSGKKLKLFCPLHINPLTPHWKDRWIYWLQRRRTAGFQFQYRLQKPPDSSEGKRRWNVSFGCFYCACQWAQEISLFGKTIQHFMRELCFQIAKKNKNKLPQASFFFFCSWQINKSFSEVLLFL